MIRVIKMNADMDKMGKNNINKNYIFHCIFYLLT